MEIPYIGEILNLLHQAEPAILIILGVVLFLFAGTVKWLVKWVGAGMVVYGLLVLLGYL